MSLFVNEEFYHCSTRSSSCCCCDRDPIALTQIDRSSSQQSSAVSSSPPSPAGPCAPRGGTSDRVPEGRWPTVIASGSKYSAAGMNSAPDGCSSGTSPASLRAEEEGNAVEGKAEEGGQEVAQEGRHRSLESHRTAMALLGAQIINGRWVSLDWDLRTGDWGAVDITRLGKEQYSADVRAVSSVCFESHTTLRLPDRPPIRPAAAHTDVHRFVLAHDCAHALNGPLFTEAVSQRDAGGGSRRSNIGGFHSVEETWDRAGSGSGKQWYGRLYEVVVEALRALATPQEHQKAVMTSASASVAAASATMASSANRKGSKPTDARRTAPEVEPKMSGWLNVSTEADFNTLHDHGDALWSMVYYVADGAALVSNDGGFDADPESAGLPCCCTAVEANYAGSLLLKTQLGCGAYGFLPIVTRPGDLWIFPGYLAHAVMPRSLPAQLIPATTLAAGGDGGSSSAATVDGFDSKPRISVACNVTACNGIDGPAWTSWAGRREQLYLLSARSRAYAIR